MYITLIGAIMNTIELYNMVQIDFMNYLAKHLETQPSNHDIHRYIIILETDDKTYLSPSLGEFHWHDENEVFLVQYKEEGKPVINHNGPVYYRRLLIQHPDLEKLHAFVRKALTHRPKTEEQKIMVYHCRVRGYWEQFGSIYAQHFDDIYLPSEIKRDIHTRIDQFIESKDRYIKFGRSYKQSFLLTGVAGSGKSSLVKAIALKYKRPLYVLSFSKNLNDEGLIDLMKEVGDNSVLLIEDLDAFFQERTPQCDINVSFSALINVLDGSLVKGNGTLIFVTANHPERLDSALIRPGRIDHFYKFDWPQKEEIREAFNKLTNDPTDEKFKAFYQQIKNVKINMSGMIDFMFFYPENYMEHIQELLNQSQLLKEITQGDKVEKLYN
jgi:AAA+ superfamily predicted ATPase